MNTRKTLAQDPLIPPASHDCPDHDSSSSSLPALPIELVEAILIQLPLRRYRQRNNRTRRTLLAVTLTVIQPPPQFFKVCVPRMPKAISKMMSRPDIFDVCLIQRLFEHRYRFSELEMFSAAMQHNRVDVLEWWVRVAKKPVPMRDDCAGSAQYPDTLALEAGAWDALEWLVAKGDPSWFHMAHYHTVVLDLVKTRGERQVHFVGLLLKRGYCAKYSVDEEIILAACDMGLVSILQAWPEDSSRWRSLTLEGCFRAIQGCGPALPMLDCMLSLGWDMQCVAEYASECGKIEVLEWWKANKSRIESRLQELYVQAQALADVDGDSDTQSENQVDPPWLVDGMAKFCLDLARDNGHSHVLAWWNDNMDLIPMPNPDAIVINASALGDIDVLNEWVKRWTLAGHSHTYDCETALHEAIGHGQTSVLDWWFNESGLLLTFDLSLALVRALLSDHWEPMVGWWANRSGVKLVFEGCAHANSGCWECWFAYKQVVDVWEERSHILPLDLAHTMKSKMTNLVQDSECFKKD